MAGGQGAGAVGPVPVPPPAPPTSSPRSRTTPRRGGGAASAGAPCGTVGATPVAYATPALYGYLTGRSAWEMPDLGLRDREPEAAELPPVSPHAAALAEAAALPAGGTTPRRVGAKKEELPALTLMGGEKSRWQEVRAGAKPPQGAMTVRSNMTREFVDRRRRQLLGPATVSEVLSKNEQVDMSHRADHSPLAEADMLAPQIPEKYHVYANRVKQFPTRFPSSRHETVLLERCMAQMLADVQQSDENAAQVEAVFHMVYNELVRQVSTHCVDRARILASVWKGYMMAMNREFARLVEAAFAAGIDVRAYASQLVETGLYRSKEEIDRLNFVIDGLQKDSASDRETAERFKAEAAEQRARVLELERAAAAIDVELRLAREQKALLTELMKRLIALLPRGQPLPKTWSETVSDIEALVRKLRAELQDTHHSLADALDELKALRAKHAEVLGKSALLQAELDRIHKLHATCPMCAESVPSLRLGEHLSSCPQRLQRCPHCRLFVSIDAIDAHLGTCPALPRCEHCQVSFQRPALLQDHLETCSRVPLACPKGCGRDFARSELEAHAAACRGPLAPCDACGLAVAALDLDKHKQECRLQPQICSFCNETFPRGMLHMHRCLGMPTSAVEVVAVVRLEPEAVETDRLVTVVGTLDGVEILRTQPAFGAAGQMDIDIRSLVLVRPDQDGDVVLRVLLSSPADPGGIATLYGSATVAAGLLHGNARRKIGLDGPGEAAIMLATGHRAGIDECQYCGSECASVHLRAHEQGCGKRPVACPHPGCGETVAQELLAEHVAQCGRRPVQCILCSAQLCAEELAGHNEADCPQRTVDCPNKCGLAMARGAVDQHIAEGCPLHMVECPRACGRTLTRQELAQSHLAACRGPDAECKYCGQALGHDVVAIHEERCQHEETSCGYCKERMTRGALREHKDGCSLRPRVHLEVAEGRGIVVEHGCLVRLPALDLDSRVCELPGGPNGIDFALEFDLFADAPPGDAVVEVRNGASQVVGTVQLDPARLFGQSYDEWCAIKADTCVALGEVRVLAGAAVGKRQCAHCRQRMPKAVFDDHRCPEEPADCPHCGAKLTKATIEAHLSACGQRPVSCPHCLAAVTFDDLRAHIEACPRRVVKCRKCGETVEAGALAEHEKSTCAQRQASCAHCGTSMLVTELEAHERTCRGAETTCALCAAKVFEYDVARHRESECPHRPVECAHCGMTVSAATHEAHVFTACPRAPKVTLEVVSGLRLPLGSRGSASVTVSCGGQVLLVTEPGEESESDPVWSATFSFPADFSAREIEAVAVCTVAGELGRCRAVVDRLLRVGDGEVPLEGGIVAAKAAPGDGDGDDEDEDEDDDPPTGPAAIRFRAGAMAGVDPCPHCGVRLAHGELAEHEKVCEARPTVCPYCSERLVGPSAAREHLGQCGHRPVTCELCFVTLEARHLEGHKDACPGVVVSCPACGLDMLRRDLAAHDALCPQGRVVCAECGDEVVRIDMAAHAAQCSGPRVACLLCREELPASELDEHLADCPGVEVKCAYCSQTAPPAVTAKHQLVCAGRQMATIEVVEAIHLRARGRAPRLTVVGSVRGVTVFQTKGTASIDDSGDGLAAWREPVQMALAGDDVASDALDVQVVVAGGQREHIGRGSVAIADLAAAGGCQVSVALRTDDAVRADLGAVWLRTGPFVGIDECPFCGTQVPAGEYAKHTAECSARPATCATCGATLTQGELAGHAEACPLRMVKCDACQVEVRGRDMEEHQAICPMRAVECEACGEKIPQAGLATHQASSCPMRMVACALCGAGTPSKELEEHLKTCRGKEVACAHCRIAQPAATVAAHEAECPERPGECKWCQLPIAMLHLARHEILCATRLHTCEQCGARVTVTERSEHEQSHARKAVAVAKFVAVFARVLERAKSLSPKVGIEVVEKSGGVRVVDVFPSFPAQEAGLRVGDVLTHLGGIETPTQKAFRKAFRAKCHPGAVVPFSVERRGEKRVLVGCDELTPENLKRLAELTALEADKLEERDDSEISKWMEWAEDLARDLEHQKT